MATDTRGIPKIVKLNPRKKMLAAYVRHRLREETSQHGAQIEIARATGFSHVHVGNVIRDPGRGVGDDFARALAKHWGLTLAQLEEEAERWSLANAAAPPQSVRSATTGAWGESPVWHRELAAAKATRPPRIPEHVYDRLAGAVVPDREPSAANIAKFAEALFLTSNDDDRRDG